MYSFVGGTFLETHTQMLSVCFKEDCVYLQESCKGLWGKNQCNRTPENIKKDVSRILLESWSEHRGLDKYAVVKMKVTGVRERYSMVMMLNEAFDVFKESERDTAW